ncbi:hypothetical protein [Paraburkholderia xenovorans]
MLTSDSINPRWRLPGMRDAELTTVRDNLRHASIATTSICPHSDEVKRAQQIRNAFADR